MANISNSNSNSLVAGTTKADMITNSGTKVTINASSGDDTIDNQSSQVSINGGTDNDSINSSGSSVTIYGDTGADSIFSTGSNVSINAGTQDDYIIVNNGSTNITIEGNAGNDTIDNNGSQVTINGGTGNDSIDNSGNNVSINGNTGDDIININDSTQVTINVKDGNDTIVVSGSKTTFNVQNFGVGDKINFTYPVSNIASVNNGVVVGDVTITGLKLSKSTSKWTSDTGITTYSEAYPAGVTMDEDSIIYRAANEGTNLFTIGNVKSTSGLTVDTRYKNITVAAAALNKQNVTVNGDYILQLASDVAITTTKSGWIKNGSYSAYELGSTIEGYELDENATLISYSPAASGEIRLQLSGLNNEPTLNGDTVALSAEHFSANLSVMSNAGNYQFEINEGDYTGKTFSGSTGADTIRTFGASNISILGGAGKDYISNESESTNATINGGAGDDIIENSSSNATLEGGNDNDTINNNNSEYVKISGGNGNDVISNNSNDVTIAGGAGNDSIHNEGNNVIISGGTGDDTIESSGTNVRFQYSGGNDVIDGFDTTSTLQLSTGSITSAYSDAEYNVFFKVGDNTIEINDLAFLTDTVNIMDSVGKASTYKINALRGTTAADEILNYTGNISIQALGGNDTVDNRGSSVTISGGADNDSIYNRSDGANSFVLGDAGNDILKNDADNAMINGGAGNDSIDLNLGAKATVNTKDGNDTITVSDSVNSFHVENFGSGDKIQFNSTVSGLNSIINGVTTSNVTITGVSTSRTTPLWSFSNNVATYSEKYSAGVILSDDSKTLNYKAASTTNLFTVTGVTSTVGIDVVGTTAIVSKSALGKNTVSISDGYNLALGDDVSRPEEVPETWEIKDSVATYKGESTVAGYEVGENTINYVAGVAGKTLLKINDVTSEPTLDGSTFTFSAENLASAVSIVSNAGEYQFELSGDDYSGKTFSGNSAADSIYNEGGSNISISGGAGNDSIVNNYGAENVTINAGKGDDTLELNVQKTIVQYTSGDGDDLIKGDTGTNISIDLLSGTFGGTSSTEEDFILQIGKNNLTLQNAGEKLISLGTANKNYVWNGVSEVTIDAGASKTVIDNKGSYVTVNSGKGNDTVTLGAEESGNTFVYTTGSGKDVIYNFFDSDRIRLDDDSTLKKVSINKNDVVFKVTRGSITLKNAAKNNNNVILVNSDDEVISSDTYNTYGIIKEGSLIELSEKLKGTYTATDNISTIDGSNVKRKVRINANEDYSTELIGGKKNDTLKGSLSDDTLTGGKGSDVFVYTGGNDIITDYAKQDKISVSGTGLELEEYSIDDDKNLILSFGNSGNLTIAGGAGKAITFVEKGKKTTNFYETFGIFDKKKESVVLSGAESTLNTAKYSKLVTIDASNVNDYMDITGNSKANLIIASEFGGTLNGGRGKDTLVGREEIPDVFVYENKSGKDVIEKYGSSDKISLGSGVTIEDSKFKKDNAVIKFKSGSLTVNNAKDLEVTLTSADTEMDTIYSNGVFIDQVNSIAKVYGSYKGTINLDDYYTTTADATETKKKVTINGSAGNDIIFGGQKKDSLIGNEGDDYFSGGKGNDIISGGEGADSLWGGKGNDTLYGGDGDDTFIYQSGEGNDFIADYAAGDMLKILDKSGKKDAAFTSALDDDGTLTIKVKGGGKITMNNIVQAFVVNINGKDYLYGLNHDAQGDPTGK